MATPLEKDNHESRNKAPRQLPIKVSLILVLISFLVSTLVLLLFRKQGLEGQVVGEAIFFVMVAPVLAAVGIIYLIVKYFQLAENALKQSLLVSVKGCAPLLIAALIAIFLSSAAG